MASIDAPADVRGFMDTPALIKLLNVVALIAIMLAIGLKVTFSQVMKSARHIRLVILGIIANFVLVPLVTVGLLRAFDASPVVAAGFLILAVCPGAPLGPPFTEIARGSVPSATGAMVILAGLSALLAPPLLSVLLRWLSPESDLHVDPVEIGEILLVTQMLPLAVGLGLHEWAPRFAERLLKPVGLVANGSLLIVVILILVTQFETLEAIRLRDWTGMLLLLLATLIIGWLCGGPAADTRRALTVTTGLRNAAVGLVIVSANFAGTAAVTAVVAYSIVSIFGTLVYAVVIGRTRSAEI
jgi:BASS family bile acid:Na+ symporter